MSRKRVPPKSFQDFVAEEGEEDDFEETNTEGESSENRMTSSRKKQTQSKKDTVRAADTNARKQSRFIVVSQFIFIFSILYIYNAYFLHVTLNYRDLQSPEVTSGLRGKNSSLRKESR
jgi:hypothetical protein